MPDSPNGATAAAAAANSGYISTAVAAIAAALRHSHCVLTSCGRWVEPAQALLLTEGQYTYRTLAASGCGVLSGQLGWAWPMPLMCCRALGSELRDLGWYRQLYRLLASSGSTQLYCSQLRGAEVFVSGGGQVMSCDEAAGSGGLVLGLVSGAGASGGSVLRGACL